MAKKKNIRQEERELAEVLAGAFISLAKVFIKELVEGPAARAKKIVHKIKDEYIPFEEVK